MEKLIYVLWKRPQQSHEAFAQHVRRALAPQLIQCGTRGLSFNLADAAAAFAAGLRMTHLAEPMAGTVALWLDTHLRRAPIEEMLASAAARVAGYLALESVPLVNTTHVVPLGERTPGFTTVALLQKPAALAYDAWLDRWQGHHTAVALETQSTFLYVQNLLVRPLTPEAPPWIAIVEEGFPAAAATDPMVFYKAGGSPHTLSAHQRRMGESCATFVDFATLEWHAMSTYVVQACAA
jgi:hypothetical protein